MSMELDKKIGIYYYGWTREETVRNNYYDAWADLWRPRPEDSRGIPTPAYSTTCGDVIRLIEHLAQNCQIFTTFTFDYSSSWRVSMVTCNPHSGRTVETSCTSGSLPEAVARCAISLKERELNYAGLPRFAPFEQVEALLPV